MKRMIPIVLMLILLCGCVSYTDPVLESLPGEYQGTMYTCGGFQDYTDYGKYTCSGVTSEALEGNPYFQVVTAEDIPVIEGYLENFEGWVELSKDCDGCDLAEMYDFSRNTLKEGDWFYLYNKHPESTIPYSNYNLYYISLSTRTVYYFHNNI